MNICSSAFVEVRKRQHECAGVDLINRFWQAADRRWSAAGAAFIPAGLSAATHLELAPGPGPAAAGALDGEWGLYRKLLPLLITANDDTLYPRDWLRRLVAAQERWGFVVAFRGRQMVLEQGEVCPTATGECAMWSGPWRSPVMPMICGSRPTRCSLPRPACCCTTA